MATLGSLGDLVLALSADTSRFQSDLGRADRIAKKFSREVGRALGTLAAGLLTLSGAAGFGGLIKSQIDAADEANKMSQKLGIATETLSEYFFAARLANVSNDQLQVGLQQLAKNQADFVIGTGEAKYAFDALGISQEQVRALNGDNAKLFELVAGKLAGFADGGNKTALAMKLLGKSGAELIPLINGLEAARVEAREFNAIIDKVTAQAAEKFNDNISRLSVVVQALGLSLAKQLLPRLNEATDRMVEGAKRGEPWLAFLKEMLRLGVRISEVIPGIGPIAHAAGLAFNSARQSVRGFQSEIRALDNLLQEKPTAPKLRDLAKEAKEAEERLKRFHAYAKGAGEELKNFEEAGVELAKQQMAEIEKLAEARTQSNMEWASESEEIQVHQEALFDSTKRIESGLHAVSEEAASFNFTFNSALEDAIINGGKLSDVVKALEQDIARMILRLSITEPLETGVRGFLRGLNFDPGGFGAAGRADLSGLGAGFDIPAFEHGTDYVPRTGAAWVHEGERIIPAGKSGGITFNQTVNIDSRSDQASIVMAMRRAKDEAVAEIASMQARRGNARIG